MSLASSAKALVPRPVRPAARAAYHRLYRAYLRASFAYLDFIESRGPRGKVPVPPARLRFRVGENASRDVFLSVGERTSAAIQAAVRQVGAPFETFGSVLDFGCGCGRTLLWLARQFPDKAFHGTDIDEESIEWCRANLPFGQFTVNGPLPPLPYPENTFDLIYGISVLTHLSEEYQLHWLAELRRVLKPGGLLLLTVHGEHVWRGLPREQVETIERNGFLFVTSPKLRSILPDWYQTAFHTRDYALRIFGRYFGNLEYLAGAFGDQDAIAARRI